jgi:parallel beta-helix repeat protein
MDQTVVVSSGEYNQEGGEIFPIEVGTGSRIRGAGRDSTFVIGPGGSHDESGAVFSVNGDAITIERLNISTADLNGVGVWLMPGIQTKIKGNQIVSSYIGIFADGSLAPRPFIIESNVITGDSIGIATGDSAEPIIRDNQITGCGIYGLHIRDFSRPDLGTNDATDAGGNTIQDCGLNNQWLIYNLSPDTIWAVGNTWVLPDPAENDQFIYDDDENPGLSGPVILENQ